MRKVWIEVALNGAWSRRLQPGIPDTVEQIVAEGIACARAGASIVHTHAYAEGGRQTFDWQVYARIIEGIRAAVDVPVYPSYPTISETASMEMPVRALLISKRLPTVACSNSP
jgi:3-keto-5-aminohexanoate cleavage enzyme